MSDPKRLSVEEAAAMLTKTGAGVVPAELIRQHLEHGAPTNDDGTINLLNYGAWLVERTNGQQRGRPFSA